MGAAANGGITLLFQATCLVAAVAELGSLGHFARHVSDSHSSSSRVGRSTRIRDLSHRRHSDVLREEAAFQFCAASIWLHSDSRPSGWLRLQFPGRQRGLECPDMGYDSLDGATTCRHLACNPTADIGRFQFRGALGWRVSDRGASRYDRRVGSSR